MKVQPVQPERLVLDVLRAKADWMTKAEISKETSYDLEELRTILGRLTDAKAITWKASSCGGHLSYAINLEGVAGRSLRSDWPDAPYELWNWRDQNAAQDKLLAVLQDTRWSVWQSIDFLCSMTKLKPHQALPVLSEMQEMLVPRLDGTQVFCVHKKGSNYASAHRRLDLKPDPVVQLQDAYAQLTPEQQKAILESLQHAEHYFGKHRIVTDELVLGGPPIAEVVTETVTPKPGIFETMRRIVFG